MNELVGLGPNVDFFSVQELELLAKKFKEQQEHPFDEEGKEEGKRDGTMANFFDDNMRQAENDRSETLAKIKARRMTKKIDGTILNRHKNVVTIVHNG
jgi:flagellar biosynthesis/type III secretory pathway protein FliH